MGASTKSTGHAVNELGTPFLKTTLLIVCLIINYVVMYFRAPICDRVFLRIRKWLAALPRSRLTARQNLPIQLNEKFIA